MTGKRKRKLAMPDTLIIVASVVLLVAILSWIIPSGTYDYQEMNINGRIRNVAIDGTYHTIDKSEVTTTGFLGFFSVLYRGCVEAADVIFMILCCCGTFGVVVKTGAFHAGIGTILKKLKGKEILLVPIIMMIFGLGGSVFGMASEFYGFYPLIVGLGVALGYDAMFGFAIIAVGEFVGFMGSDITTSKRASSALMPRTSTSLSAERMLSSLRGASRRGCGLGLGAFFFSSTRRSSFSLTVIFIGPACTCTPPSLSAGASTVAITPPTLSRRTRSPFCTERTSSASTTRFWMPRRCSFSVWVMTPRSAALAAARFWSAFFFCAFF